MAPKNTFPTTPKKSGRPWKRFLLIIALFIVTIYFNIPKTSVNWNLFGREIKEIGGYHLNLPFWQRPMDAKLGLDLQGGVQLTLRAKMDNIPNEDRQSALDSARTVIERRVNAFGVSEPIVQSAKVGDDYRIIVELAGVTDVNEALRLVGTTAQLEFREPLSDADTAKLRETIRQEIRASNPELSPTASPSTSPSIDPAASPEASPSVDPNDAFLAQLEELLLQQRAFQETTDLTGNDLRRAEVVYGQAQAGPAVSITFNDDGARKFAEMTQRNIAKPIGIFLDDQLVSAPLVNEAIFGGQATITGGFTQDEAKELATQLNAGALPVPIEVIEQRTIGATLGQKSVNDSVMAGAVGLGLVAVFMIIFYRGRGIIATLALILYALISMTIFRYIPVTLTLAGVAGFILSIGMAIDANILIFERIKEEIKWGKSPSAALRLGFERAWSSIKDSNVSSLITCLILYYFGTGLIKGFAVTLAIGIVVSMFTAITVTRILLLMFTKKASS